MKVVSKIVIVTVLMCAVQARAALQVDFNGLAGGSLGNTQSGFTALDPSDASPNSWYEVEITVADAFGAGLDATVSMHTNRWKKRGALTDGDYVDMSDLLYDYAGPAGNSADDTATNATLGLTLPQGSYNISVYHHESNKSAISADLTVTDADGARATEIVTCSFGKTPAAADLSVYTATIASDGSEIIFEYENENSYDNGNTNAFPINGLVVTQVPEPSITALLGLGSLVSLYRRRKQ